MEKYELTDKDFELLDRLIKNNTAIESLYTKMYNMEIAGVKKSSDFDKQLELLRLSLEAENRIYEETNLNSQKCLAYIRYIKEVTGDENFPGGIENIVAQNGNYIVFMRIANRLTHKLNSDIQYKRENIHPIVMGILENMGLSDFEKRLKQAIYVSNEIEEAFERDFINAFLSFLKGAIDSEDYSEDCKEGLIVCKYYTSYIYSFVEPNMIACGF